MNTLVLSKSRKGNLPIEISAFDERKQSNLQPTKPIRHPITASVPMVTLPTTKSTDTNHLHSADFLSSPLDTILESICDPGLDYISLHDLIEAYSTLSARIRSQARNLVHDQPLPAIEALRVHSSSLTYALKRDLRRILLESSTHTQQSTSTDLCISAHDIQYARDIAALCLHALCFLSDVFVFKALYSVFSDNELRELLRSLLKLALVDDLATPSRLKTWTLVVWIMQVQNLPSVALEHERSDVTIVIQRSIDGELGSQARLDGLKAIPHFLVHHPTPFIASFVELLPSILDCLTSDSADCRMNAAIALSGFALAKINTLPSFPHDKVAAAIHSFIRLQTSRGDSSQDEPSLSSMIRSSLLGGTSPTWALTVLATIIVLLDYSLFLRSRSIKFCLNHLAYAASHKYSDVAALHPHIWRLLVWAFSRFPHEMDVKRSHVQQTKSKDDLRVGAFKVVAQVLEGGVGIALTSALLGTGDDTLDPSVASGDVLKALDVVGDMIAGKSGSDPEEGLLLLNKLVSAIGTPSYSTTVSVEEWEQNHFPSTRLVDGTILHSTVKKLGRVLRKMEVVKMDRVRRLSEVEIIANWDHLVTIWASSVQDALRKTLFQFWGELLHIWQSLLLAKADLAEQDGHLTASSAFAKRVASTVTQFLPTNKSSATVHHLILLRKLWNVVKNIFSTSWLHSPAEIILAAVLMRQFSFQDENTKAAWSGLCADLILAGIPSVLHVVSSRSEGGQGLEVTRQLWTVLAKAWQASSEGVPWGNLAAFLAIPYRWGLSATKTPGNVDIVSSVWEPSDTEFGLWDGVLRSAVKLAGVTSVRPVEVVTSVLQQIGGDRMGLLSASPKAITFLLSHVDLSVGNALPVEIFSSVNLVLVSHYSNPKLELQPILLEFLHSLGRIIETASPSMLIQLLVPIEQGICLWIRDEREALSQTQHDTLVTDVYCRALATLRYQEPTLNTLLAISTFLTSGFGRLHEPLVGPLAFEEFWRATYHNIDELRPHYSESLRSCLLAFSDTWGGSMGDGLSNYSESQRTKMSTVPDSQPPRYDAQGSWGYPVDPTGSYPSPVIQTMGTSSLYHTPKTPSTDSERAAKRRKFDHPNHLAALNELQQYSSLRDDESSSRSIGSPIRSSSVRLSSQAPFPTTRRLSLPNPEEPSRFFSTPHSAREELDASDQPGGHKRSADVDHRRSPKRQKTDPWNYAERVSHGRTPSGGPGQAGRSPRGRPKPQSAKSEPILSSYHLHDDDSQNTQYRKRRMVLDWVGAPGNPENHRLRPDEDSPHTPEKAQASHANRWNAASADPSSPEDYNSWEVGVSIEENKRLQHELSGSDHSFHEAEMDKENEPDDDITNALSDILLDSLGKLPDRPQLRQLRSQTAPGSIPVRSPSRPGPLRRNQTTSTRLNVDGLLQTCAAVEDNASQVPVADLMHATALINKIGTKLTEHLTRRLVGRTPQPD